MVSLAAGCLHRGHRVDLVLGQARGAFLDELPDGVRVIELGRRSAFHALPALGRQASEARGLWPAFRTGNPHWILGCIPELAAYLRSERPEAMFSALDHPNLAALWARRLSGVPTRLGVSERNTLSRRARVGRRNRALPQLVGRFYPWADGIGAVSNGVADDLARTAGLERSTITTIGNPLVGPDIEKQAGAPVPHPWLGDASVPVVLGAGKLRPQKGFDVLLRAFAVLRRRRPVRLIVLGEGPGRGALSRLARRLGVATQVDLPGFVVNPFAWMSRARVFALSSRWEGLPGVLVQALACGCPVVATDCPSGPDEILEGGRFGRLVPVDDVRALASALEQTLDAPGDPALRRDRAGAYSVDRALDRTLALLLPDRPLPD